MLQRDIACILMRGGTSRGPYFNAADLPADRDQLAQVLISALGAGSPLQVDGIGGGQPTTSKVAMLSPSDDDWAEVDYFFAQVHAEKPEVDFSPSCGNILAGVGPAALEMGLVKPDGDITSVKIRNINTDSRIEAKVETPNGSVNYQGDARIDGVPGTAAPIILNFMDVIGSKTGALFPTGRPVDVIDGKSVTCLDVAMPMMIVRAEDFGIAGYESREEVDAREDLFAAIEPIRIKAGEMMGFSNVAESVVPKVGLLAAPREDGAIAARYLMPWKCHPSFAVTGSICTGSCVLIPGTVAEGLGRLSNHNPLPLRIEHPSGAIDVVFDYSIGSNGFELQSAGLLRTARKLFTGSVSIPGDVWRSS